MTRTWRNDQPVVHTVVRDRGRSHTLEAMSGPEFTGVGAVYGWLGALPAPLAGGALAVLILIGMGACTAAWIDYQDYTPLPNICRAEQLGSLAQQSGSCVPATPAQSGVVGHG